MPVDNYSPARIDAAYLLTLPAAERNRILAQAAQTAAPEYEVDMIFTIETDDIPSYLQADSVIDWTCPIITALARELTAGHTAEVGNARALFEWVRDTIPHTRDVGREEVTCCASQVLATGTGICYAKAHLLAALLRAVGIPAGFCYQVYEETPPDSASRMVLHGLNGIYLQSLNKWVRVDCRGNKDDVDAQFDTDTESLAFPDLEFLDNRIYAQPLPQVVRALQTWPTRSSLWPHLPGP